MWKILAAATALLLLILGAVSFLLQPPAHNSDCQFEWYAASLLALALGAFIASIAFAWRERRLMLSAQADLLRVQRRGRGFSL